MRWVRRLLLFGILPPVIIIVGAFAWLQTGIGKRQLAGILSDLATSDDSIVTIEGISGFVPVDFAVAAVRVADGDGVWLTADEIALSWRPTALLAGGLAIETVGAQQVHLRRLPAARPEPADTADDPSDGPLVPELPVDVAVGRLSVPEIVLDEPVLGQNMAFSLAASARLGDPSEGLSASIDLRRTDGVTATLALTARYVPDGDLLSLDGSLAEPAGGVLANLLGRPDLPAVTVSLAGEGTLDDWQGRLAAEAGDMAAIDADVTLAADGADRRIGASVTAAIAPLLPAPVDGLAGDTMTVTADVTVAAGGPIRIHEASLEADAAAVSAEGVVDPAGTDTELFVAAIAGPSAVFEPVAGPVAWDNLHLEGSVAGLLAGPSLSLTVTGVELGYQRHRIGAAECTVTADAAALPDAEPIPVTLACRLDDVRPADPVPPGVAGPDMGIDLAGTLQPDGRVEVGRLALDLGTAEVEGSAALAAWGATGDAALAVSAPSLGAFAAAAGIELAGRLAANVNGHWGDDGITADLAATIAEPGLGIPEVDRLLESDVRLEAAFGLDDTGELTRADLVLDAGPITASAEPDFGDRPVIDWTVGVDDIGLFTPVVGGPLALSGRLSDPMGTPGLTATGQWRDGTVAGLPVTTATLTADVADLTGLPQATVSLDAEVAATAVTLDADVGVEPDAIAVPSVSVGIGDFALTGEGRFGNDGTITTTLAGDGSVAGAAALAGLPIAGRFAVTASAEGTPDDLAADVTLEAGGVAAFGIGVGQARLDAQIGGIPAAPALAGNMVVDGLAVEGVPVESVQAEVSGSLESLSVALTAQGADTSAALRGNVAMTEAGQRIDLAELTLQQNDLAARLVQPTQIRTDGAGVAFDPVVLALGDGTVTVVGRAGQALDVTGEIQALPLGLVAAVAPDVDLTGRLDGRATVTGPASNPNVAFEIAAAGVGLASAPIVPTVDATGTGRFAGGVLTIDVGIEPEGGGDLAIAGTVPTTGGALAVTATGELPLGVLEPVLSPSGNQLTGTATVDLAVGGTLAEPDVSGTLAVADGRFENDPFGVILENLDLRASGSQGGIRLDSLTAGTPGGGRVQAQGTLSLNADDGMPVAVSITAADAVLFNSDLATADVDLDLTLDGQLAGDSLLSGTVGVNSVEIRVPDTLPPSFPVIDVEEINRPDDLPAIAQVEPAAGDGGGAAPVVIALDIQVDANSAVFLRGRGLDTEVGGLLTVGGTADAPTVDGVLEMRRGRLDVLGRRFTFETGRVTMPGDGSLVPGLNFRATTPIEDGTGIISVTGRASAPRIGFSARPELPEDEVLARILFGRSVSDLSPFQAASLARSVAELSGIGGGDVLSGVRSAIGLDEIDLSAEENAADTLLGLGSYLTDNVYVGVEQGIADPTESRVTVEVEITPNISVETDVGSDASGRVGVTLEWDY